MDDFKQYSEVVREGLQLRYPDTHFSSILSPAVPIDLQGLGDKRSVKMLLGTPSSVA